ncbi:MAG: DUF167 family protein [Pseudomonadota bacterium]
MNNNLNLKIYLTPRSSKNKIKGWRGDELAIAIAAPPVDGAANENLIKFLSKELKIPKSSISIIKGVSSRHKTLLIQGVSENDIKKITALV